MSTSHSALRTMLTLVCPGIRAQNNNTFSESKEDNCMPFPDLETALQQYQDPAAADKITKIQKELEETKQV
jgi:hypothetical protein